jgi:putative ABC transport system ATP-binding protein
MSSDPAIRMRGLFHVFRAGPRAQTVLHGVDLTVAAGEFVMLMGPSGCGKTTVLTLAGALRAVQSGEVTTLGVKLWGADEATRTRLRRRIGFVYQHHNLHGSLTAAENVRMALEVQGPADAARWTDACLAALNAVDLGRFANAYPATLSGGQRQRVVIARAIVARPKLILADEPTAALDRDNGRRSVSLLRDLARAEGSAVLMVTHDSRVLDLADRIVEMDDGRILEPTAALWRREALT